jgi:hypothetical protein
MNAMTGLWLNWLVKLQGKTAGTGLLAQRAGQLRRKTECRVSFCFIRRLEGGHLRRDLLTWDGESLAQMTGSLETTIQVLDRLAELWSDPKWRERGFVVVAKAKWREWESWVG